MCSDLLFCIPWFYWIAFSDSVAFLSSSNQPANSPLISYSNNCWRYMLIDQQYLKYSDQSIWHQQPCHIQNNLNLRSEVIQDVLTTPISVKKTNWIVIPNKVADELAYVENNNGDCAFILVFFTLTGTFIDGYGNHTETVSCFLTYLLQGDSVIKLSHHRETLSLQ